MPVGTINWSISEYEETGVFLDANIKIIRASDGHVYLNAFTGAGSVQIPGGTEVYVYGYILSANTPPTYWGPTYNRATLRASVAGVTSNTETISKVNGDFAVSSGNFTVSSGTTYTANVATINPYSTTGNLTQVEIVLAGGSNGSVYPCYDSNNYETYDSVPFTFRAYNAAGNEVTPSDAVTIPIYEDDNGNVYLYDTLYYPPTDATYLNYQTYCDGGGRTQYFGTPSVNGIEFIFNNTTFRFDRPS
jgi:hypothetical protein